MNLWHYLTFDVNIFFTKDIKGGKKLQKHSDKERKNEITWMKIYKTLSLDPFKTYATTYASPMNI